MSEDNSLKTVFVDECEELLGEISEGLAFLDADTSDMEALNAVFRGVHSIKGGAGSFQMDSVVRFAHTFETALDSIRKGESALSPETLVVLLRSSDCLAAVLDATFSETEHDDAFCKEMEAALKGAFDFEEKAAETLEFEIMPVDLAPFDILDQDDEPVSDEQGSVPDIPKLPSAPNSDEGDGAQGAPEPVAEMAENKDERPAANIQFEQTSLDGVDRASPRPVQTKERNSTLRVDAERIDLLINTVGELIINQSTILERFKSIEQKSDAAIDVALDEYRQLTSELQERVLAIRAQPVKSLFQRMGRVVREVSNASGKPARLVTEGEETEVDKTLVQSLAEPLTHMIRNSVDHGLEMPEDRKALGKDETGSIKLSAYHTSGNVIIEIADDGAGLNREKINQIAVARGLVPADADLSASEIDRLLFMPGFSTADKVSDLSGRGVGMDVVKNAVSKLGGTITTSTAKGQGTTFKVAVPLTLAVMDGIIVRVGKETMVLPTSCVVETVKSSGELTKAYGPTKRVFRFRNIFVPIVPVADGMNLPDHRRTDSATKLLIIAKLKDASLVALEIDNIVDRRQLVIKGLETNCGDLKCVSSAAVLGDGKLVLIIDPDAVTETQGTRIGRQPEMLRKNEEAHVG